MASDLEKGHKGTRTPKSASSLNDPDAHCKSEYCSDSEGEGDTFLHVSIRERIHHFTFAWYTLTMSTGGIALLLILLPYRFPGLTEIGTTIFILDLVLQTIITALLIARFVMFPSSIRRAFTEPPECIFVGTFFLSLAAMFSNIQKYGVPATGPWLPVAERVCFWIYTAVTFLLSVWQYDVLFKREKHLDPATMTPAWILPIFPIMLAGTLAGFFAPSQPEGHALAIIAAGAAAQGLGMVVSVCFYGTYLARMMGYGLPALRPGMFMAVGPPSFTAAALVSMGADVPRILAVEDLSEIPIIGALNLSDPVLIGEAFRVMCVGSAVFLWGLSFWFCLLAIAGLFAMPDKKFHLSWWSFVFPNVGFTIATLRIGDAVGCAGVMWLGVAMTIILVTVWLYVLALTTRAVWRQDICWPGKDEDAPHH